MGLDITAYRQLTECDVLFDDDDEPVDATTREPIENYLRVFANPDFPGRAEGLKNRAIYTYADAASVLEMGYGRYNRWREQLAKLAGYPLTEYQPSYGPRESMHAAACWQGATGPFSELINFSDCEGDIGPVVAAKLTKDFAQFDSAANALGDDFYSAYAELKGGVDMAADGGALHFH